MPMSAKETAESEGQPLFVAVKQRVREGIRDGRFSGKLPPERDLAEAFGVSYMTLRRAIGDLVEDGVLRREQGRGTFVVPRTSFVERTGCVGMILAGRVYDGTVNPVYGAIFQGVVGEAERHRYAVMVAHSAADLLVSTSKDLSDRRRHRVDGIIVGAVDDAILKTVRKVKDVVPVVLVDGADERLKLPSVVSDHAAASAAIVEHLAGLGHRRIAYVAGPEDSHSGRARREAFAAALAAQGLALDPALLRIGDWWYSAGEWGVRQFLDHRQPPTAIVCANDTMAIGAMNELHARGVSVPDDISVVGYDDLEAAALQRTPLTTVRISRQAMGEAACRLLLEAVAAWEASGELAQASLVERQPVELVVRGSTAAAPA